MSSPVTLITGASAGLGVDFAREYAARGHRLVLVARREDRLQEVADEVGNARIVAMDLSEKDAVALLMTQLHMAGEHVDVLINNAGFGLVGRFHELDGERQRQMIDLNIGALTDLAHACLGGMVERGRGEIMNVASVASFQPGPGMAVYFATKAYVLSFSEALHEEVKPHGIKVSALCPGPTSTEFGKVAGFGGNKAVDNLAAKSIDVVKAGIAGLDANKAVVVPGMTNKMSAQAHRIFPRSTLRKIVNLIKK
ncbi:SDR family NAD(P)-dependent oxidoreductase [Sphingomicrobium marinum]|uniref:SDR family NAD(P)-dependent oxidoreductase n=1 Tax=Sphingomicrobium marinum TaxID=1227950 RepID=UPI002240579A|nr:SDR family oxidoreductase [Sphingomicrobium marinum]